MTTPEDQRGQDDPLKDAPRLVEGIIREAGSPIQQRQPEQLTVELARSRANALMRDFSEGLLPSGFRDNLAEYLRFLRDNNGSLTSDQQTVLYQIEVGKKSPEVFGTLADSTTGLPLPRQPRPASGAPRLSSTSAQIIQPGDELHVRGNDAQIIRTPGQPSGGFDFLGSSNLRNVRPALRLILGVGRARRIEDPTPEAPRYQPGQHGPGPARDAAKRVGKL